MSDDLVKQLDKIKTDAMKAFGHQEGVTLEDALALMIMLKDRHRDERNEVLNINARQAGMLAKAWKEADAANAKVLKALAELTGGQQDG